MRGLQSPGEENKKGQKLAAISPLIFTSPMGRSYGMAGINTGVDNIGASALSSAIVVCVGGDARTAMRNST